MTDTTTAKSTKGERGAGLRRPTRGRGIARYQALLEATEALLQDSSPDAIGLYQIAEQAGVPPASVYHFFKTKEAAYQALAERYLEELVQMHSEPIEAARIKSWQDLYAIDMRRAMDFYNARPPMMKILYGGYGGVGARNIDILVTNQLAAASYARINLVFELPLRWDMMRAQVSLAMLDAIWTVSVRNHGLITEEYYLEALRACTAYRRLYWPEVLKARPLLTEATVRGESIQLPYTFEDLEKLGSVEPKFD